MLQFNLFFNSINFLSTKNDALKKSLFKNSCTSKINFFKYFEKFLIFSNNLLKLIFFFGETNNRL